MIEQDEDGYHCIQIRDKRELVHMLVARAFLLTAQDDQNYRADHLDGNIMNNCIGNLRWVAR